ncbi:MAG: type 4a pilus biogenesis protein PilO [Endozoicomonadaceae bacterium]|nr:type 4a pilus biogenesis protein PilO [Endozoicomonadaceae bacterium]
MKKIFNFSQLQTVNFRELTLDNMAQWPITFKSIIAALLSISICFVGYNLFLIDKQDDIYLLIQKERTLKEDIKIKINKITNHDNYRNQLQKINNEFSDLLNQLPNDREIPTLLEDITKMGVKAGLEFNAITLRPEINNQFFVELPIQIQSKGTYHEIGQFISAISAGQRIVTLHDFKIQKNKQSDLLDLDIIAKTYRYKDNEDTL